jgi:hypothetical protein
MKLLKILESTRQPKKVSTIYEFVLVKLLLFPVRVMVSALKTKIRASLAAELLTNERGTIQGIKDEAITKDVVVMTKTTEREMISMAESSEVIKDAETTTRISKMAGPKLTTECFMEA